MADVAREDYTWAMAAKDLALTTPLTLREALEWTSWADGLGAHPFDALPFLTQAVRALPDSRVGPAFFGAMAALVKSGTW